MDLPAIVRSQRRGQRRREVVEIQQMQRDFVGAKVFHREHALAYTQTTVLIHVVVTRLPPLPQFLRNVGEGRNATS